MVKVKISKIIAALLSVAVAAVAWPQTIDRPVVQTGDTWVYRETTEKAPNGWTQVDVELRVIRVTPSAIFITTKTVGSSQPPKDMFVGLDWSRVRDVNGKETVVNRPLAFPLSDKKTWEVTYTEENPNKKHKSEKLDNRFTVVGYEAVEVPAGKYRALKIEAEGRWEAEVAKEQRQTIRGNFNGVRF